MRRSIKRSFGRKAFGHRLRRCRPSDTATETFATWGAGASCLAFALTLGGALGLGASCGDPSLNDHDGGTHGGIDAMMMGPPPQKPLVSEVPSKVPYPVVTIHGTVMAKRVVVEGAGNPIASAVLPDGTFCIDVALRDPGTYALVVIAQAADGQISEPAGPIEVEFDVHAPGILHGETCSGADPAGCPGAMEICGNGKDDNCNNLVDANDPACTTCTDDVLEPNNDTDAPRIDPGRYDHLQICPANQDYYGVFMHPRDEMVARIFFVNAMGNLDMHLLGVDHRTVLARSVGLTDDESITYTATTTGEYKLRVFSDSGAANSYSLDLRITPHSGP